MGSTLLTLIESVKLKYGWSDKTLAGNLGVSSHSILSWKSGRRSPKRSLEMKLEELGQKEERKNMEQSSYIIELQKEKIERLENELKENRQENEQSPTHLDLVETEYHFSMCCDFKFNFIKMSVQIMYKEPCSEFKIVTERLGYSEQELRDDIFSFDKMMPYSEHTIHKLRTIDDKARMMQKAKNVIRSFSLAKNGMARYEVTVPVVYRHKNGSKVYVQNRYVVDWFKKTSTSYIHFMNGDN